jgi:hypothetical protein
MYLYSVEPVRMHFPAKQPCTNDAVCNAACSIAHSMHSDWFNGVEILQGRWQHGEKVGYCYPSGLEKTLCKLVTKGLIKQRVVKTCGGGGVSGMAPCILNVNPKRI